MEVKLFGNLIFCQKLNPLKYLKCLDVMIVSKHTAKILTPLFLNTSTALNPISYFTGRQMKMGRKL